MRSMMLGRSSVGVGAACLTAVCGLRQQQSFASSDAPAVAAPPADKPQKPGIYQKAGFDPTAIEQVAAAARTTRSQLSTSLTTSVTTQKEEADRCKQYSEASKRLAAETRDARRREDEKTRNERSQHEASRSQYKSTLAHERANAATRLDETLKDGEEASRTSHDEKMESIRRESAEFEANLRRETDAKYVHAAAKAGAILERETHDLKLALLREKGKAAREATVEAVGAVLKSAGSAATALLGDERRMIAVAGVVTAATVGVVAARHSTRILSRAVEAQLRKPALVRETSRGYALSSFFGGSRLISGLLAPEKQLAAASLREKILQGAAFEPTLEATLVRIAAGAANTRANNAPFRHVLLHGPPGTGKTLFAKRLAKSAGLDFAIASGGDVAPLGRDAVTQIHKLFDWAATSPRGLVLLIDEADAFVRSRSTTKMSEDARNALNAFLYRTGSQTKDVLVVFATNAPEILDSAIHDRVDDILHFKRPREEERLKILQNHLDTFTSLDIPLKLEGVSPKDLAKVAKDLDGFSARQVSKLALAWRAAAFGSKEAILTPQIINEVTQSQIKQSELVETWHQNHLATH